MKSTFHIHFSSMYSYVRIQRTNMMQPRITVITLFRVYEFKSMYIASRSAWYLESFYPLIIIWPWRLTFQATRISVIHQIFLHKYFLTHNSLHQNKRGKQGWLLLIGSLSTVKRGYLFLAIHIKSKSTEPTDFSGIVCQTYVHGRLLTGDGQYWGQKHRAC